MTTHNAHEQGGCSRNPAEHAGRRHHLLIAGTGRAGTSALVRYLTAVGLETHLSKNGEAAAWFDAAQAGLEDIPVSTIAPDLPYVVKSPWSYQFVDEILSDPHIQLDAVIVPIRDLTEAAASRTIMQLQAVHQEADWMAQMSTTWEHWGSTPGGTVFSLNPIDQARLLAVGFHRLLERLVQADVPTVLLAFPRLASDPDYLFGKLSPVLPIEVSIEQAREAHAATFSATMVRVEDELSGEGSSVARAFNGPSLLALDNAALRRSLIQLRGQFAEAEASRTNLATEGATLREQLEHQRSQAAQAEARRAVLEGERDMLCARFEQRRLQAAQAAASLAALEGECDMLRRQLERRADEAKRAVGEKDQLQREVLALRSSRSWRITWPLRALSVAMRGASRSHSA